MVVLLDYGANKSCVSLQFVKHLGIRPKPLSHGQSSTIFTANDSIMKALGIVDLDVSLDGLIVPHTFLILVTLHQPCILGINFLIQTSARILWDELMVSFYEGLVELPLI